MRPLVSQRPAGQTDGPHLLLRVAGGPYRAPNPFLCLDAGYIVRLLAPDSTKIDLADEDAAEFGHDLLFGMGSDLAAINAAEGAAACISRDLVGRSKNWLHRAAKAVSVAVEDDFTTWAVHHIR
jgi:hypothetical protein